MDSLSASLTRTSRIVLLSFVALVSATGVAGAAGSAERGVMPFFDTAGTLTFYPQAGILGRDLFMNNHVDLDPGPGILDYMCGTRTYDGHTGQDYRRPRILCSASSPQEAASRARSRRQTDG